MLCLQTTTNSGAAAAAASDLEPNGYGCMGHVDITYSVVWGGENGEQLSQRAEPPPTIWDYRFVREPLSQRASSNEGGGDRMLPHHVVNQAQVAAKGHTMHRRQASVGWREGGWGITQPASRPNDSLGSHSASKPLPARWGGHMLSIELK